MPTKLRDSSPDPGRVDREREKQDKDKMERKESRSYRAERGERGERRERDPDRESKRKHRSHRTSSSTKEKSASRTSLSSTGSRKRSSGGGGMPDLVEETQNTSTTPAATGYGPQQPTITTTGPAAHTAYVDPISTSASNSRASTSYPAFSREHSKEAVGPRPDLNLFTPPSTDVNASKEKLANINRIINNDPPSPPLTEKNASNNKHRSTSATGPARPTATTTAKPLVGTADTIAEEEKKEGEDSDSRSARRLKPRASKSSGNRRLSSEEKPSSPISRVQSRKESVKAEKKEETTKQQETSPPPSKRPEQRAPSRNVSQSTRTATVPPEDSSSELSTIVSSDATSIAPEQPSTQKPANTTAANASNRIPPRVMEEDGNQQHNQYYQGQQVKSTPIEAYYRLHSPVSRPQSGVIPVGSTAPVSSMHTPSSSTSAAGPPPPPPPPPHVPASVPKVDYLLQYGGLNHTVPKNLLYAGKPMAVQMQQGSPGGNAAPAVVNHLFEPYNQLLLDFEKVMTKNGSLAVATGYRSVARRLLDRLEAVFARDLSSEICTCTICRYEQEYDDSGGVDNDNIRGVSWGEILELVSGRKDLPSWPPFSFAPNTQGLGIDVDLVAPMQKLDIDVPEEYREHYIRQSQKTKQSVDRWLNRHNGNDPMSSAPAEVDDETLTFAILTYIGSDQRTLFKDLLGIIDQPLEPPRRAPSPEHNKPPRPTPTPMPQRNTPEYILAAGLAIQRLYRLGSPPRDPETALYLLNNPSLHHPLATLSAVSSDEWDILISGRFDGFLRSGAEEDFPPPPGSHAYGANTNARYGAQVSRMPSRGATPAYGPTQARSRQNSGSYVYPRPSTAPGYRSGSISGDAASGRSGPIALDEETEIAALAEIERDIYVGMEALEDAFEALHLRAESVRDALRKRSAGLAAAAQRRKQSEIEIRAGTPSSQEGIFGGGMGAGLDGRWEIETDDGLGDDVSELAPDDSASNISSVRRRKRKRRNERRTPVVGAIDEEDESERDGYGEDEGVSTREPSPEKKDRDRERDRNR